jgi:Tfp pilus assembly ATPase PilU
MRIGIDENNMFTKLKASLWQSPDVIILDEVRGSEASKEKVNEAITEHLVWTTFTL